MYQQPELLLLCFFEYVASLCYLAQRLQFSYWISSADMQGLHLS